MARDLRYRGWVACGVHLIRAGLGIVGVAVLLSASVVLPGSSAAAATNLIANGSFESGGSYSFAGWKTQNATQAGVASTAPGGGSFATAVSYSGAGGSFQIFASPRPVLDTVGPVGQNGDDVPLSRIAT